MQPALELKDQDILTPAVFEGGPEVPFSRGPGLSAAEVAMVDFCLKLSRYAPSVVSKDIERLRT
jgi:hypothetical protein